MFKAIRLLHHEPRDLPIVDDNRQRSFGGFRKHTSIMDRRWS